LRLPDQNTLGSANLNLKFSSHWTGVAPSVCNIETGWHFFLLHILSQWVTYSDSDKRTRKDEI